MSTRRRLVLAALGSAVLVGGSLAFAAAAPLPVTSQALTVFRTCTITATPSTTTVVTDSVVKQASATGNFGTQTSLAVSSSGSSNQRAYVRFDLTQCAPRIPSSATVQLATLRLYATALPGACRTIDIFDAPTSWTEAGLTWNNQPFGTTLNNPSSATRTDSFDAGAVSGCLNQAAGYLAGAVVTADVATWVAGTASNNGWMLRDDAEGSATTRTLTISSKNLNTLAQAPQLVVTYVAVP